MQTFLPTRNFRTSAKLLDYRRLGKQRVEGLQLINSLSPDYDKKGWLNHPARLMWVGYENALKHYTNIMIEEWVARGYNNTMKYYDLPDDIQMPDWIGDDRVHASHRSNLLRKDPSYYSVHGWTEPDNIEYFWPVEL